MLDLNELEKTERQQQWAAILTSPQRPVITYLLLLANAMVFGLGLYLAVRQGVPISHYLRQSEDPRVLEIVHRVGASSGMDLEAGRWWRLLTLCFAHIGVVHLLMNMMGLFVLGRIEEPLWGRARFLAIYLISGLAGSCALIIVHPQALGAGASGAVWGLLMALAVWVVAHRHSLGDRKGFLLGMVFLVIVLETSSSFLPGISAAAHFGGGGMGLVLSLLFLAQRSGSKLKHWLSWVAIAALPPLCLGLLFGARALAIWRATLIVNREAEEARQIEQRMQALLRSADESPESSVSPARELLALVQNARDRFLDARERMGGDWVFRYPKAEDMAATFIQEDVGRIAIEEWMVLTRAFDGEDEAWRAMRLAEPLLRLPASARDDATAEDMALKLREEQSHFKERQAVLTELSACLSPGVERRREEMMRHMEACANLYEVSVQCLERKESWSKAQEGTLGRLKKGYKEFRDGFTAD
jgi:membrane associated rhomboid family serine protease